MLFSSCSRSHTVWHKSTDLLTFSLNSIPSLAAPKETECPEPSIRCVNFGQPCRRSFLVNCPVSTPNSPLGSGRSRISARNTLARKPGSQATTQQARLLIRILTPGVQEFNEFQSKFNFQCRRTQLQTSNHKLMKLLMNDIHLNRHAPAAGPSANHRPGGLCV